MKALPASMALTLALAVTASAQQPGNGSALSRSMAPLFGSKKDPNVIRSDSVPEPTPMAELEAPKIPLPATIDQTLLLQKENGPFMVTAYSFVGPDAAKYAQLLVMELRQEYKLPAYIWYARIAPSRSLIRRVQPTANDYVRNGDQAAPELWREKDEAIVLVGNCKTQAEALDLRNQVKKIKPVVLTMFPTIYTHRQGKGLYRALVTTNPFQAAQNLFPGKGNVAGMPMKNGDKFDPNVATSSFEQARVVDPLVKRMNNGKNSLFKNSSDYTMGVAEFSGRAAIQFANQADRPVDRKVLEKSPLMTAHDDAEELAAALAKCEKMKGYKPYVFHTRSASYVTVGGFKSENDPAAKALRAALPAVSHELMMRNLSKVALLPSEKLMPVPHDF